MIEPFVVEAVSGVLSATWRQSDERETRVKDAITRITLAKGELVLALDAVALAPGAASNLRLPFHLGRGREGVMIGGAGRPAGRVDRILVRAIVLAKAWAGMLERGEVDSIKTLAKTERLCVRYTARLLPLAYLAPPLVEAILDGRQPIGLMLTELTARDLPLAWSEHRAGAR